MSSSHTKKITRPTPPWYDAKRAQEILDAYNRGAGSTQPADEFAARSVLPAGTGSQRDFQLHRARYPSVHRPQLRRVHGVCEQLPRHGDPRKGPHGRDRRRGAREGP